MDVSSGLSAIQACLSTVAEQTGLFSFLRHIFSAADKAAVIPCGANGEENWTGPIRLRPQNRTAAWMGNFRKSFSDYVIQDNRHWRWGVIMLSSLCLSQCQLTRGARRQYGTCKPLLTSLFRAPVALGKFILNFCLPLSPSCFCVVPSGLHTQTSPSSLGWWPCCLTFLSCHLIDLILPWWCCRRAGPFHVVSLTAQWCCQFLNPCPVTRIGAESYLVWPLQAAKRGWF